MRFFWSSAVHSKSEVILTGYMPLELMWVAMTFGIENAAFAKMKIKLFDLLAAELVLRILFPGVHSLYSFPISCSNLRNKFVSCLRSSLLLFEQRFSEKENEPLLDTKCLALMLSMTAFWNH